MQDISLKIEELREELIKDTQKILKIKSVEIKEEVGVSYRPFGKGIGEALEFALALCKDFGFRTVNMDGYIGYAEYGEGEEYVGVLGHLDVVPEGDGWTYPPYKAEIHDNKIYARGTLDDKGPLMAALYGLRAIKELNLQLSKKVRIIFGTNEETGYDDIEYYVKREKPPVSGFTPDADFPVIFAEKGIAILNFIKRVKGSLGEYNILKLFGGNRPNMVPDFCTVLIQCDDPGSLIHIAEEFGEKIGFVFKGTLLEGNVQIKSFGKSAHGSTPELGKNAIMAMFSFLGEIIKKRSELGDFINFFYSKIGFETRGESLGIAISDEPSGALIQNIGMVDFDGERISLISNVRFPVTFSMDQVENLIREKLKGTGINLINLAYDNPLYYEKNNPLIKKLLKVYEEETGEIIEPLAIGTSTYAKSIPNIVAYGPIFPGDPDLDHQPDEYIEIEKLVLCSKIYGNAIYELAR
ncbi:dipeptidase PepV [Clostridium polyendosporum]|uniref:Dipeptidase PepV n=1 Tax=Clostridium polyendosporum TaxID=69208 RepID=A0A919RYC9_9CLOT|nr:dipeptidase PepV [Clostridium polyendosporum]GIM28790.1 dipeptidase PepV [Clostridium polyendosporum]